MKEYFTASILGIFLLSVAYSQPTESNTNKKEFAFDSGGEYHFEGFGGWRIRLSDQKIAITHRVRGGEILLDKQYSLTQLENDKLWDLIERINLPSLESSARAGIPDEVMYTFIYKDEKEHEISIWKNDASKIKEIKEFVVFIKELIEIKTGKEPVLE